MIKSFLKKTLSNKGEQILSVLQDCNADMLVLRF